MLNISVDAEGNIAAWDETALKPIVYNEGDIAWILASTALVWIMVPGIGFFYSGLLRRKNALSMIYLSMATLGVVSLQWFFWGFSLTFSETASPFIGDLRHFGLMGVTDQPSAGSSRVPTIVYCIYQLMFAALTPMLAAGAFAERVRLGPALVWVFVWATVVYDPIACWTWNPRGWSFRHNVYDFAGGTPVHISSGTAALAISVYLGKRAGYGTERLSYKPQNTSYVVLGTALLWFGWFGFNGGSALSANLRAAQACIVTNLAASVGGITWLLWDWRLERKWSAVGFCSGAIAGLVAITPGSGFVGAPASLAFGVAAGSLCNFATQLKYMFGYDDCLDIFAAHAVGGLVGNVLTGFFAQKSIARFDGTTDIEGGWLDHHWIQLGVQLANSTAGFGYSFVVTVRILHRVPPVQLGVQLANSTAGFGYSFVVTTAILWAMHYIPGLRLRADARTELLGVDDAEMGEFAYDYVGLESDEVRITKESDTDTRAMSLTASSQYDSSMQTYAMQTLRR